MKLCSLCNQEKPFSEFYHKRKGITYFKECKECMRAQGKNTLEYKKDLNARSRRDGTDPIAREILAKSKFWNEIKKQDEETQL